MSDKASILAYSLASFRAKVAELESKLSIGVLYGQGHMILADAPAVGPSGPITLVLGSFDRPGHYAVNSPRVFCSLDITPDHLCGVSLWAKEDAERNIEGFKTQPELASLTNFRVRHIREEQTRRLANWREMVKHLESIPA